MASTTGFIKLLRLQSGATLKNTLLYFAFIWLCMCTTLLFECPPPSFGNALIVRRTIKDLQPHVFSILVCSNLTRCYHGYIVKYPVRNIVQKLNTFNSILLVIKKLFQIGAAYRKPETLVLETRIYNLAGQLSRSSCPREHSFHFI